MHIDLDEAAKAVRGPERRKAWLDADRALEVVDAATSLAPSSTRQSRPAWLLVFSVDLLALVLPGAFVEHGRFVLLAFAVLELLLLQAGGQYRPRLNLSVMDDAAALAFAAVASYAVVAGISHMDSRQPVAHLAVLAAIGCAAQVVGRFLSYTVIRSFRARGLMRHDTLIFGCGQVAGQIALSLLADPSLGLRPVGYVADGPRHDMPINLPHLGGSHSLAAAVDRTNASIVIVAFNGYEDSAAVDSLRLSERRGCSLFLVPRLYEIYNYGQSEHIGAIPVVRVRRPRLNRATWLVKRSIDLALSGIALLLLLPVMVATAIAVRLEGGPGIIFRQTRIGLDGREFQLMKFRSLKPVDEHESATMWNVSQDDRMGKVGRVIRRSSIDELPQLFNVLRGEMTLVGPRPERPHFVAQFTDEIPDYAHRHRVPAGLTGLAQVSGLRGDTSIVDRARYDNFYIENWSLWFDVKIMAATLREVVGARGA